MAPAAAAAAAAKATTALSSVRPASAFKPSVDLWSDLLMACLVIFVVLAPSYFFRVEQPIGRTSDKKRQ
jgi:hypothetical protein